MPNEDTAKRYEIYYWIYVIVFIMIMIPLQFYWPFVAPVRYTRQLPVDNPGALSSDVWTWGMVREGAYAFAYFIVISGLFMVFTRSRIGKGLHAIVLLLFGVWFLTMAAFDIYDMAYANVGPMDPHFKLYNPARDSHWCCLYGKDLGTERLCANTNLCDFHTFHINPNFMFRVIMNGILFLYVVLDAVFTLGFFGKDSTQEDEVELVKTKYARTKPRIKKFRV